MPSATQQQLDAIQAGATLGPGDVMKIIAFAGAGKTFTLSGIAKARKDRGLYLAFNKDIAREAQTKFEKDNCDAKTIHAVALRSVIEVTGSPVDFRANDVRDSRVIEKVRRPDLRAWSEIRCAVAVLRTVSAFCNSADPDMTEEHARQALKGIVGDPDFMTNKLMVERANDALDFMPESILKMSRLWWAHCMEKRKCNHDMYLKVLDVNASFRDQAFAKYNYLLVDEAQDLNPVQMSILRKSGLPLIAVGDSYQSIYSWRGAVDALQKMNGKSYFLTQSFRFGENIASIARDMLAARPDGGPEQQLEGAGPVGSYGTNKSTDAIICRTNIGVINEALSCVARGKKFKVDNIKSMFVDLEAAASLKNREKKTAHSDLIRHFQNWDEFKDEAEAGQDQTLKQILRLIEDQRINDVRQLSKSNTTTESPDTVSLTTIHKSKGNEWKNVRLGSDCKSYTEMVEKYKEAQSKSEMHLRQSIEEFNTVYVGVTRAINKVENYEMLLPEPQRSMPVKA